MMHHAPGVVRMFGGSPVETMPSTSAFTACWLDIADRERERPLTAHPQSLSAASPSSGPCRPSSRWRPAKRAAASPRSLSLGLRPSPTPDAGKVAAERGVVESLSRGIMPALEVVSPSVNPKSNERHACAMEPREIKCVGGGPNFSRTGTNRPLVGRGVAEGTPSSHSAWAATAGSTSWAKSWSVYGREQRGPPRRGGSPRRTKIGCGRRAGGRLGPGAAAAGHVGELPTAHHVTLAGHEANIARGSAAAGPTRSRAARTGRSGVNPSAAFPHQDLRGHAHEFATSRAPRTARASRRAAATSRCSCGTCPPGRRYGGSGATSPRSTR